MLPAEAVVLRPGPPARGITGTFKEVPQFLAVCERDAVGVPHRLCSNRTDPKRFRRTAAMASMVQTINPNSESPGGRKRRQKASDPIPWNPIAPRWCPPSVLLPHRQATAKLFRGPDPSAT